MPSLPWIEPLDLAAGIDERHFILLYSSAQTSYSGRYSLLACGLKEQVEGADFSVLEKKLSSNQPQWQNAWFGYLGYGLKDSLEALVQDQPWSSLPHLWMGHFATIYLFDHEEKTVTLYGPPIRSTAPKAATIPVVITLQSNMSREEYLSKAAQVIEHIHAGNLYQANLTRKFFGEFTDAPDGFALFKRLCEVSPAPYSAFLHLGEHDIISSSPELFLRIDAGGNIRTRPIKGTAARSKEASEDKKSRDALAASAKDRAENLMIADLMRNDLARSCIAGSVEATNMFEVTSHATIHHMASTITGRKRPDCSTIDAVKHCFPPGSMTGAPKIRAMDLCSELERQARGVYSGAVGWFGGDGSAELSVVIRTLILGGRHFEFQVGGGIVADSTPQNELSELLEKSRGVAAAIGLDIGKIAAL